MISSFGKSPLSKIKSKNQFGYAQDTPDMISPKNSIDHQANITPKISKKHVIPFETIGTPQKGIRTFDLLNSDDFKDKPRGLKKIDTSVQIKNKELTFSKNQPRFLSEKQDYSRFFDDGQHGKQNLRSWNDKSLGRAMVGDKLSSVKGNLDLGFECKPTQKEDTIEKVLKGKKRLNASYAFENVYKQENKSKMATKFANQIPGFFLNEGIIVGSTNPGRVKRKLFQTPKNNDNKKVILDRPFDQGRDNQSRNHTLYKDKQWLDSEFNELLNLDNFDTLGNHLKNQSHSLDQNQPNKNINIQNIKSKSDLSSETVLKSNRTNNYSSELKSSRNQD